MSESIAPNTAADPAPAALPDAVARFAALPEVEAPSEYNFAHFRTKHLLQDGRRTVRAEGIRPGDLAPDFVLPRADGLGTMRLSDLLTKPVLLHFGSFT